MILEIQDMTGNDKAFGHIPPLPKGVSLGEMFEADERLRKVAQCVVQASLNGTRVDDWQSLQPEKHDKLKIVLSPKFEVLLPIFQVVSTLISVYSVVSFFVGLFTTPKPPKLTGADKSSTYSFDGIQTTFTPGDPVPVIYGMHRVGGQLLSMAIDVTKTSSAEPRVEKKRKYYKQEMSMLIGLGEGLITDVNCVKINGGLSENFPDVTLETRLGGTSQSAVAGFEAIRNTFRDGREFSIIPAVGSSGPFSSSVIYSTVSNSPDVIQLQVSALNGIVSRGAKGAFYPSWSRWSVEYRQTATTTFTVVDTREMQGATHGQLWDIYDFNASSFGTGGALDFRLTWLDAHAHDGKSNVGLSAWRLWLMNVTEVLNRTESFSSTALLAVRAVATQQLSGGRPNFTSLVRGRSVRAYSDETTFVTTWTRNPAWCVLDYMTNSMYGMGAYITTSDVNIQSFIDFATLCNSQVPNGAGGLEAQHMLDLVMDTKRPHWSWVLDTLANYRSALIYSQQQWKLISDRADLPLRQVFHSGNMVPGRTTVKIGSDPLRPNQANVTFANANLDYTKDPLYVQDSASVFGSNDPIKDFDMSILGVTRESEALRAGAAQLDRRRQVMREVSWATGLEALAVEPGDMARVGIVTTDWEMGFGGRVLEGDTAHATLDREIEVRSGYAYDLFLWHVATDSMESRTLANTVAGGNSTAAYIVASPTAAFGAAAQPGDRWAVGINSEDLMLVRVKSVGRNEAGQHELTGEQFVGLSVTTPSLVSTAASFDTNAPPSQPIDVRVNEELVESTDGTIQPRFVIIVTPSPKEMGGRITVPGTTGSVTLAQSQHPTPDDSLNNERIRFVTGAASGYSGVIGDWGGSTRIASVAPPFATVPVSGDAYSMAMRDAEFEGFDLYFRTDTASAFALLQTVLDVSATVENPSERRSSYDFEVVPFSPRGVRNQVGNWRVTAVVSGDFTAPATPSGLTAAAGTGRQVLLDWSDNTEADLSYYEIYRHTSNAFGGAAKIANASVSRLTDVVSAFETPYYYWIRAYDASSNASPIHPGSTAGVTIAASNIITLDISSNAATLPVNISNVNCIKCEAAQTVILSGTINTVSYPVKVTGKFTFGRGGNSHRHGFVLLRTDNVSSLVPIDAALEGIKLPNSGDFMTVVLDHIDTPSSGTVNYSMQNSFGTPPLAADDSYARDRKLTLIELRR